MVTPRVGEETPRLDNEEEEEDVPHGDDEGEDTSDGLGEAVDGNADEAEGVRLYTIVHKPRISPQTVCRHKPPLYLLYGCVSFENTCEY